MTEFNGFPKALPEFFDRLTENNSKEWFDANRKQYESDVKTPSIAFVNVMGERLAAIRPDINAIPKVNQSLFRLNRDTRFSHDKSPYKTNMGILFWIGAGKRMERPGFYFHYEPGMVMLGAGMHQLTKQGLAHFREAVADPQKAKQLQTVLGKVDVAPYAIGTRHYKRLPRGFEAVTDFQAEMLLYNSLTVRFETGIPAEFHTGELIEFCFTHFNHMAPVNQWLLDAGVA